MFKHRLDRLIIGARSLIREDGYSFSEADKALLEEILAELEEMSKNAEVSGPKLLDLLSLVLRYLKFFGIDDITGLF